MSRISTAVNKKLAARERGPHRAKTAESSDQKRSTAIATTETWEYAKILRREGLTLSPLIGIFAGQLDPANSKSGAGS
jgi:hypothetical protein